MGDLDRDVTEAQLFEVFSQVPHEGGEAVQAGGSRLPACAASGGEPF